MEKLSLQFFASAVDDEEQKKLAAQSQQTATAAPVYANTYGSQMSDMYSQIANRQPFQYKVDEDALYQQYRDKYTQAGKQAMRDSMGQASALTGGYGSSYSGQVGQQTYDSYLQSMNDVIPDLYNSALNQYNQQGQDLQNQFSMLGQLQSTEYGQYTDALNQYNYNQEQAYSRQQDSLSQLQSLITSTGYKATPDDLAASGMTQEQADSLYNAWINRNPLDAFNAGAIDENKYYAITGQHTPGYVAPRSGGGGDRQKQPEAYTVTKQDIKDAYASGYDYSQIYDWIEGSTGGSGSKSALIKYAEGYIY